MDELRVYLDHLIQRESLRYQRPTTKLNPDRRQDLENRLALKDLLEASGRVKYLRKPDFQRSTWAWTAEDCVLLLESLVNEQVVPSIIMWSNEETGTDYILDGGHRISVVLAWLRNEWEDKSGSKPDWDEEDEKRILRAASDVRNLVKLRIGEISEFKAAEQELEDLLDQGNSDARQIMGGKKYKQARFYQKLLKGRVTFHILWVEGDYQRAELSFLRINKSGRQLTDWETKLVENRNSSLARIVMSLTSIESAQHYWPTHEQPDILDQVLLRKRQDILNNLHDLYEVLFKPSYQLSISRLQQPIFAITDVEKRPYYLAELFTIIQGGKGYETETKRFLESDKDAQPSDIIERGWQLVDSTIDTFAHLVGTGSNSLSLVPVVYFYTESGKYVRSLLYGMLYWLFSGSDQEILNRKRLFTIHRAAFEHILLTNKDVVSVIGRQKGSGTEITAQTAQYFHTVLELLIEHNGDSNSNQFSTRYDEVIKELIGNTRIPSQLQGLRSHTFSPRQKSTKILQALLEMSLKCEICGGILDPQMGVQHDHITQRFKGGETTANNQRIVHPFCNHEREIIQEAKQGQRHITLPAFVDSLLAVTEKQMALPLVFFDDKAFLQSYPPQE